MADISEHDARVLLRERLQCQDYGEWIASRDHPGTFLIRAGVTNAQGRATQLTVELRCRGFIKERARHYLFTVLVKDIFGERRVYQLEVNQPCRAIKDRHKRSHEHVGGTRRLGPEKWRDWSYDEVFLYFCSQTNIRFQPAPPEPWQLQQRRK